MMRRVIHPLLILLAFAASALAWPRLPDQVPVHWNLAGDADRYGSRFEGVLLMPLMMLLTWAAMRFLPKIDPRRANYARMEGTYEFVITLTLLAMLAMHGVIVAAALGHAVPMDRVIPVLVGALFVAMGNVLPRAKPNWWFGVRTPWTLSSEQVWRRTHRVAGYTMVTAGLVLAATALTSSLPVRFALLVAAAIGAVVPVVYSYLAWRKETSTS